MKIAFSPLTLRGATERCMAAVRNRSARPFFVVTPNALIAEECQRKRGLLALVKSADLRVADGAGILLASRLLGSPLPERIAGIDLAESLLREAEKAGLRVFLLGGKRGVAEKARARLLDRYPELNICGTHHGYFQKNGIENNTVIDKIRRAAPDLLFVCFGFPTQEKWIASNLHRLKGVGVCIGLGGSLDVWSGNATRAPRIIISAHLEWLWRMIIDPKRLSALPKLASFALSVLSDAAKSSLPSHLPLPRARMCLKNM